MIYTLAGTLPMGSAILLLPFYIHHLSGELYGALSIYLAISLLVQILVTYSFDTSIYIHYHEYKKDREKLSIFVSSAFIFVLLLGAAVGILFTVAGDLFLSVFVKDKTISFFPYGVSAVGIGIFQAVFKIFSNLVQTREKPEIYMWSNIVMFSLIAMFTIGGLALFPASLIGPMTGRLLASALVSLWALYRIFKEFGFHFDFAWLRSSFSFNNNTFLYQLFQWVINYFDRILMAFFLPLQYVGIYDFGMKCLIVVEVILNSLHNAYYPKVVSTIMEQPEKGSTVVLNRYYYGTTAVVMLLTSGCVLVFPFLVDWLVWKPDYRESIIYLPLIACPYLLKTMRLFFAVPYGILKKVQRLPKVYFVLAITKVALMASIIPYMHIYGVIIASLLTGAVEVFLLRNGIKDVFHFRFNSWKLIIGPLILMAVMIAGEWLIPSSFIQVSHLGFMVICIGLLFWMYRNEFDVILSFRQIKKV